MAFEFCLHVRSLVFVSSSLLIPRILHPFQITSAVIECLFGYVFLYDIFGDLLLVGNLISCQNSNLEKIVGEFIFSHLYGWKTGVQER